MLLGALLREHRQIHRQLIGTARNTTRRSVAQGAATTARITTVRQQLRMHSTHVYTKRQISRRAQRAPVIYPHDSSRTADLPGAERRRRQFALVRARLHRRAPPR